MDRIVARKTTGNRSQAIEALLRQSLSPRVTTAVLLAGGENKGGPIPALQSIDEQKLIFITLQHLVSYGIQSIYILAGPHEDAFKKVLEEGEYQGARIRYISEDQPLGTAGAVKMLEGILASESFLVMHADVLTRINLADFIAFHNDENPLATIAVKPRDAEKEYGKLMLQGNTITEFSETNHKGGISIVNTGVYLLHPEVLRLIDPNRRTHFETDIFPTLARRKELSAFFFQGIWFDISSSETYRTAQARWKLT